MRYAYPCSILRDEEEARASGREAYTVTFPMCTVLTRAGGPGTRP